MAPFKSSAGRSLGKLLEGYKSSTIGQGFGSGGSGGGVFLATGGNETVADGKRFHVYNSLPGNAQTFEVLGGEKEVKFILVAGGGSGCGGYGGGGAGGGIVYSESLPVSTGTYTCVIGAGGAAPESNHRAGNSGADSSFTGNALNLNAKGGGGGGLGTSAGATGGCGGGGGSSGGGTTNQPSQNPNVPFITNYGNNGGVGPSSGGGWGHGGGGGAGEVGQDGGPPAVSGRGGAGLGPPTWSWLPTSFGHNGYFAGGGGGSGYSTNSTTQGAGSPDGTGGAAGAIGGNNGASAVAHTGGGGGAAGTPNPGQPYNTAGGAGAGGALIIAYDIS